MRRILALMLAAFCFSGCLRGPRNDSCQWPPEALSTWDPQGTSRQRHLSDDAELAEDLAIRYADRHRGPHSGHFEGMAEYARTRDGCMATLFHAAASTHRVSDAEIRQSLGQRRVWLDLLVAISFALLYAAAAYLLAGRVNRLYPSSESLLARASVVFYASAIVSLAGVVIGELWAGLIENLRVGSGHLSYRGVRVPWSHHSLTLFIAGAVLFWIVAAIQHRASGRRSGGLQAPSHRIFDLDSIAR